MDNNKILYSLAGKAILSFDGWREFQRLTEMYKIKLMEDMAESAIMQFGEDAWIDKRFVLNFITSRQRPRISDPVS